MHDIEGLGLGLNLIKYITTKYEGTINIEKNTPHGTIFIVQLKNIISDEATQNEH